MKFSRDFDPSGVSSWGGTNNHWVSVFEQGTVEPGSSGSPLYDMNHRIVGQLHGDQLNRGDYCNQRRGEYGRFDISWTGGGTNATRLNNWLDPNNTGAVTTNATNVSALLNYSLNLSITGGSNSICSGSSTYTLIGAPAGANIVWSISNTSIASLTSNGTQATVTKTGNGSLTLTATVGANCFTNNAKSKTIRIGTYMSSEYNITQYPNTIYLGNTVQFGMPWYYSPPETGTTYNWYWDGSLDYISGQGTSVVTLGTSRVILGQTPWVIGKANNSCGSGPLSQAKYLSYYNTGRVSLFKVYPNPTTSIINIQPDKATLKTSVKPNIIQVELIDKLGSINLIKQFGKGVSNVNISVAQLRNDIYVLRIFDGKNWYSQKIIIQH